MRGLSGFNLPQHQEVISDFVFYIRKHLLDNQLQYDFFVAPELRIKSLSLNEKSIIPDIVIKDDKGWNQPIIIIEVSRNRGYITDIKKVKRAVKKIKTLKEGYIFNYESGEGCRICKPNFEEEDGVSYSEILDFDLNDCLRG